MGKVARFLKGLIVRIAITSTEFRY